MSVDGSTLKVFPHARKDQGVAEKLGIQALPALITVHPQNLTGEIYVCFFAVTTAMLHKLYKFFIATLRFIYCISY